MKVAGGVGERDVGATYFRNTFLPHPFLIIPHLSPLSPLRSYVMLYAKVKGKCPKEIIQPRMCKIRNHSYMHCILIFYSKCFFFLIFKFLIFGGGDMVGIMKNEMGILAGEVR